jgi:hypothetical protein
MSLHQQAQNRKGCCLATPTREILWRYCVFFLWFIALISYQSSFQLFSDFFDSEIGSTTDKDSYKAIAEKAGIAAGDFLYLTDLPTGG